MIETEVDEYKLNSTGREQSLKISLINNEKIAMILINKLTNERYSSYLSLQSLQKLTHAFDQVKTIQEALKILKNTIESGNIALTEDSKDSSSFSILYEISLASGSYPEFEVNLNLEDQNDNDYTNGESIIKQEELPPTFDYQGDKEAEAKYGNNIKGTTEYSNTIIKPNVKPPIVQLEYIEPILQVHYPDGTTKSKALPPRIQGADGETPNISEEQFKLIQEQMNKNTNTPYKNLSPIKDNFNVNRSNSVTKSNKSMYSTQTTPYPSSNNMTAKNPFGNVVRPAMQYNTNNNMNNINQVRSAFSINQNQNTQNNTNYKTTSEYSTMTMQYNRPYSMANTQYAYQTPNPNMANNFNNTSYFQNSQNFTSRNVIEERRPRMTNQNPNMARNTARSLSTPGHDNFNKFNPHMNTNMNTNVNPNINQANQNRMNNPFQTSQTNYSYQNNILTSNNFGQMINNNMVPQDRQVFNRNINSQVNIQTFGAYNTNTFMNQNNARQTRPNSNLSAMQHSQELIQSHQKRLQEVQRQLALIQQQQQKLQEQQKQLMLQQQMQRQIIQKQTMTNNSQSQAFSKPQQKFQGFAQVSQINRQNQSQQFKTNINNNSQIRQSQTSMNNQPFTHKSSQEIKQTKTTFNSSSNPPFKTQLSTPISIQTPKLSSYSNLDDEISEQQIALAQMASMQNQENPEYQNLKAIALQQKEEEAPEAQEEEEQVQYEQEQEEIQEKTQEQGEEQEQLDIEALFMTEDGRVIFRNGLLRGIIHKYAEIDNVITKIQDILLKGVKFTLVYKAFDMGDKAETFHEKCDKLNMSLVLIETDKDIRFGGFTMKSWEGNNIKKKDNNAFVFSLETNTIFEVIKNEPAIGCYPKFGPVFFGCQIRIYDEFFEKGGTTCHKGLNFKTKNDYELNNGEQNYLIKDIEVYGIEAIDV